MSNLTFDERLIREHTPAPLEGHIVVVLERVGESGEKFHSLLGPGAERPRLEILRFLRREPSRYFAFAVDASKGRLLAFSEQVRMADGSRGFELQFSLWYRVLDPRLLVATRDSDPLGRVRRKVSEVITEEIAGLPWLDVWHSFRVTSDAVVAGALNELKAFARDCGISIAILRLRASFPESVIETDRKIHEVRERGRLGRERLEVAQELQNHRSSLRRDDADREEEDRAAAARRALQAIMIQEYEEFLRGVGSVDDLQDLQRAMAGAGPGSAAAYAQRNPGIVPGAGRLYRVWYATNRRLTHERADPGYGSRLDDRVHLGSCDVVIPASHRIGELGSGWIRRLLLGTDDRLRLHEVMPMETESFWAAVRRYAATFTPEHRHALVFIHGYRVSFRDAAIRAAQLGYDLDVKGPVAFFSWPSRATLIGYPADGSAVEASEAAITGFLLDFTRRCGADRVHVIAHSMGNRPLLRALQRIVSAADAEPAVRFGHLVLAAPDVTRELFLDVAKEYRRLSHRTTLYVSDEDRALRASFRLQGPRVGLVPPVTCVEGIDTVHVANVDRTLLGHSTYAEARPVLYDIHALLNYDAPPERRAGLIERQQGNDRYWEVRA